MSLKAILQREEVLAAYTGNLESDGRRTDLAIYLDDTDREKEERIIKAAERSLESSRFLKDSRLLVMNRLPLETNYRILLKFTPVVKRKGFEDKEMEISLGYLKISHASLKDGKKERWTSRKRRAIPG